jgi:shikimate dehydrogenase
MIPLAAVIGHPVHHSRSPRLHGHWLARHGLSGHYVPLQVTAEDLAQVLRALPRMGFVGANVTIPHKETVLELADAASDTARRIGAANTLTFRNGEIHADNTDAHGFSANIRDHLPGWAPRKAALIGAGGASRAVIVALLDAGATEIRLTNRNPDRARDLAHDFGPAVSVVQWADREDMLDGCDTLINGTSLGMAGQPELALRLDALPVSALVTDLVYSPLMTDLLLRARTRGHVVVDGLGMLLHQAAPGFARWFGTTPQVDDDLRAAVLA